MAKIDGAIWTKTINLDFDEGVTYMLAISSSAAATVALIKLELPRKGWLPLLLSSYH